MARKSDAQNALLTAVARKLGQAAGTLAKMLTDQPTSQSASQAEPSHAKAADPDTSRATARRSRAKKQRPATEKRRTSVAKRRRGSRTGTSGTKRSPRRKG